MKNYIIALFLLTIIEANSQNVTLRVLGQSTYVEYAETNGIIISFNENELKNVAKLSDSIASIGIMNQLKPIYDSKTTNLKKFRIEESNLELFDKLMIICNYFKIRINKVYYKLPIHKFDNEDEKAILALDNANSQAKVIADNLKCNIVKILNIDDETTYADPIYDDIDVDSEHGQMVLRLIQLLSRGNSKFDTESSKAFREGGYNIWVTYELRKI